VSTTIDRLRSLIQRTDPEIPPHPVSAMREWSRGDRETIARTLASAARDATTVMQTLAICDAFLSHAALTDLRRAPQHQLLDFVLAADGTAAQHLRRNSLLACQRALALAGRVDATSALETLLLPPLTTPTHRPSQSLHPDGSIPTVQQETGTNDEILVLRLSDRFGRSRYEHRPAAALAIATSGAGQSEGPGVRWLDRTTMPDTDTPALRLKGNTRLAPTHGRYLAPRTVPLDRWEDKAVTAWALEAGAEPGSSRSMIYTSTRSLGSVHAVKSYLQAIDVVRTAAALDHLPGTTAGGITFWAAANAAVWQSVDRAAAIHGTDSLNLLRKLTHVIDRAYR